MRQRKVGPEDARSWLLVNGARTDLFDTARDPGPVAGGPDARTRMGAW